MHTARMLAAGFALLGVLLLLAPKFTPVGIHPIARAVAIFLPLWLVIALGNLAIGVNRAGYTVAQETPILLLVFGLPAMVAWLVRWRFGRSAP